jgi:hypothetical protein
MDGRWNKDTLFRLTPDPIAETKYADTTAGNNSRRYYVVAVDALGQEGFPSSPVWFQREWRAYYKPFLGEWQQATLTISRYFPLSVPSAAGTSA